ncbi:MptD family putative ECF transporter S component [Paenibacillus arenilitoris]|uniref:MptD family putative ECF transporter S component n=1 Tax=Paenibacillus arenilitoris TaxID=2772299 RepID=A0A927CF66_9BACL|nr:MptD family putative ECF transporter S component [Paenibacillus arenilitoris]MBD2866954.1 MptD family putative ECF transporter S component [Paenibacillus arenilitoris]
MQPQANVALNTNRWTMRDFITLAIFNVVMLIILTACNMMIVHPIWHLIGGGVVALINGPVYMVLASKIGKPGVLFFNSIILGLYYTAFGFIYFLMILAVFGALCELAMRGSGTYKKAARNAIGYGIYYVGYSLCGFVPLILFREQYMSILEQSYTPAKLEEMLYYYSTPSMVIIMCVVSFVGSAAGCLAGSALLKKHVRKAKLV